MFDIDLLTNRKVWLAPLAGITDLSFRMICKICGADVVVSEMVSADGLIRNPEPSLKYAKFAEAQRPFGIQLFGSDPKTVGKAIAVIENIRPDFIDFNMGCPVKKVIKKGAGSALMKDPDRAVSIVKEIKKHLSESIPLSVKIRSGWDIFNLNAIDFALRMEDSGVNIICLHARTRSQMYSGRSDWDLIAKVKSKLSIPLVGNGDIKTPEDAKNMLDQTGCDSIMIGRGAMGKPWIFNYVKQFLASGTYTELDNPSKFNIIKEHCELTCKNKSEEIALKELRTHLAYYTKGFRGGSYIRDYIVRSLDLNDNLSKIRELYNG